MAHRSSKFTEMIAPQTAYLQHIHGNFFFWILVVSGFSCMVYKHAYLNILLLLHLRGEDAAKNGDWRQCIFKNRKLHG